MNLFFVRKLNHLNLREHYLETVGHWKLKYDKNMFQIFLHLQS